MKRLLKPVTAAEQTTFAIPVKWQMRSVMEIPARHLKEAVQIVNRHEYDLPQGEYIDGSFEIDFDRLEES